MKNQFRKGAKLLLAGGLCLSAWSFPVFAEEPGTEPLQLYVSVNGSDEADGSLDAPFATLEKARDAIRSLKEQDAFPTGGVIVNLRGGTYKMTDQSFALTAEDSGLEGAPVVYQSFPGEKAVLDGSFRIAGDEFTSVEDEQILLRLPAAARSEVLVYDLNQNGEVGEIAPIKKNGFGWLAQTPSASVSVDGQTQTLARYPNEGYLNIDTIHSKGFVNRNHLTNADGTCPQCTKENGGTPVPCQYDLETRLSMPGGIWTTNNLSDKAALWSKESDIWTHGYFSWAYAEDNCHISGVEQDGSGLKFTADQPSHYGIGNGNVKKFYAYNLLCEIDEPGEYYIDRENKKLYLYPPKDLENSTVSISLMSNPMIHMDQVKNVQFKNLGFENANSHGIEMLDSENTLTAGCSFTNLGQLAVKVGEKYEDSEKFIRINDGAHGGSHNVIESCDIRGTGQGGIYLAGGNRYTLTDSGNVVRNCKFEDYSVINRTYCPAVWLFGVGSTVENCQISDEPHMAIQIDGNNHVIKNNDIYNVCYETSDAGAIYTGRTWSFRGTVIENNYIHDMVSNSGVGSAGIYIDDMGCGIIARNNLFSNMAGRAMLYGGGRDNVIENNITLNSGVGINYDNRSAGWGINMVTAPNGQNYLEWKTLKEDPALDQAAWAEAYPALWNMDLSLNSSNVCVQGTIPAGAVITNNIFVGVNNALGEVNGNVKSNGTYEGNETYAAGTDVGFVDPAVLDFHVQEGSILDQKLGENHFDPGHCGLYVDEYRSEASETLDAPVLVEPADQAEDVSISSGTVLRWNPVENAGSYHVEIAKDAEFENVVFSENVTSSSVTCESLEKGTAYFWRVSAVENHLNAKKVTSAVFSFTTSETLQASIFEGCGDPELPGWTRTAGTPVRTDQDAHSGKYSLLINQNRQIFTKKFAEPQKTTVSMWMYDTNSKESQFTVAGEVSAASLRTLIGVNGNKTYYSYREGNSFVASTVERTEGWHEFKWDYSTPETGVKMYVDGTLIHTTAPTAGFVEVTFGDLWNQGAQPGDISNVLFDEIRIGDPIIHPVPAKFTVPYEEVRVMEDQTKKLEAALECTPDYDLNICWDESEAEVARMEDDGTLHGVRAGTASVFAYPEGFPEMRKEIRVQVIEKQTIPVSSITLNLSENEVLEGKSFALEALVAPEDATDKTLIWTSSDPEVAAVDSEGTVYANKAGEAVITARSLVGDAEASMNLTVLKDEFVFDNSGFELGTLSGWSTYPVITADGCKISIVQDGAYEGSYAARVVTDDQLQMVNGSGYSHKGIQYMYGNLNGSPLPQDVNMTVKAWVKVEDDKSHELGIHVMARNKRNVQYYPEYVTVSAEDGWVELETVLTPEILSTLEDPKRIDFVIGNKNNTESAGTYLVDNASFVFKPVKYALEAENAAGSGSYRAGQTVALTPILNEGDTFLGWNAEGLDLTEEERTSNPLVVTMPAGDIKVTAEIEKNEPVVEADKRLLVQAIQSAEAIDLDGVNELVKAYFNQCLANAKEVNDNPEATQAEVNEAWSELVKAIQMTGFTSHKENLQILVEEAEKIDLSLYEDDEASKAFLAALEHAREVLADPKALDETSINPAYEALAAAMKELHPLPVEELDFSMLDLLIDTADQADLDAYIQDEAFTTFQQILEEARTLRNEAESQAQIDACTAELHQSWLNLRLKADEALIRQLQAFVDKAASLDASCFSACELEEIQTFALSVSRRLAAHAENSEALDQKEAEELAAKAAEYMELIEQKENDSKVQDPDASDLNKPADADDKTEEQKPDQKADSADEKQTVSEDAKNAASVSTASSTGALFSLGAAAAALAVMASMKNRRK